MLTDIRLRSQQLVAPRFSTPAELVRWFGAVQAQDFRAAKWAVGLRIKSGTLSAVNAALERGEILRLHIMRPTWHFVAAEDVRWLLSLSGERIKKANLGFARTRAPDLCEAVCARCNGELEKILSGRSVTRADLTEELLRRGLAADAFRVRRLLECAEADGIIVSGPEQNGEQTYALLAERAPACAPLTREECLARLARRYFQSHSPASRADFTWWSGLTQTQARAAVDMIRGELLADSWDGRDFFVHETLARVRPARPKLHLLPPYDEYLIAYKDRSAVLPPAHAHKAHNAYGVFHPVAEWDGRIVGNWKASARKAGPRVETEFFPSAPDVPAEEIDAATRRYARFLAEGTGLAFR